MSLHTRPRFIRPEPKPKGRFIVRWDSGWPRRDDCPTCAAQRDEHGRLPIGLCGPDCLMARPK